MSSGRWAAGGRHELRRRGLAAINSEVRDGIVPAADTIARVPRDAGAPAHTPSNYRVTALIIACALFMEQMDSTVLATALPTMARDFGVPATSMGSALTSYLLALAIFILRAGGSPTGSDRAPCSGPRS